MVTVMSVLQFTVPDYLFGIVKVFLNTSSNVISFVNKRYRTPNNEEYRYTGNTGHTRHTHTTQNTKKMSNRDQKPGMNPCSREG